MLKKGEPDRDQHPSSFNVVYIPNFGRTWSSGSINIKSSSSALILCRSIAFFFLCVVATEMVEKELGNRSVGKKRRVIVIVSTPLDFSSWQTSRRNPTRKKKNNFLKMPPLDFFGSEEMGFPLVDGYIYIYICVGFVRWDCGQDSVLVSRRGV